nr:hypothetical protein [Kovacikia minuta]
MSEQKSNKPLFSLHYLTNRIQQHPEWQEDGSKIFAQLKALYKQHQQSLPTMNEAQTEQEWVQPILNQLGFVYIVQTTTRAKGRAERPDYALFTTAEQKAEAYKLQTDESAFYSRVSAIAEAKYWERSLSKVTKDDQKAVFKNENPSFQIVNYLTGTGVDWGILTNGREWRLHYRQASSTATEFYAVDLVDLLNSDNLEEFKYFWCFFRRQAFEPDPQGRNFLERVREGSTSYARMVEDQLKKLVFEQVFPNLAGGFVADAAQKKQSITPKQVYEATLSFLYKLLFLLYAEARNLLPSDRADYRDSCSLTKKTEEIARKINRQQSFGQKSASIYNDLLNLFSIIDEGDPGLGVPRYNGGLFHFRFQPESEAAKYPANHFLTQYKLTDAVLAPVLDKLSRIDKERIDYSFIGVRHLGAIYEGLLEYRVVIEDASTGKVHLETDKGERKATGSYYTPEYIVKYIVSQTLKPILAERQQQFQTLMDQIAGIQQQKADKRLGTQSINGLNKDLKRLQKQATTTLLDIKVCDPAMGSGHFLVEAVDFLTDEVIGILTRKQNLDGLIAAYETFINTRDSDPILDRVQHHLSQDPEEADVIHDLLAYLAQQMIDLNKQKQAEIKGFLTWLDRFIGAPIDSLTNKSRLQNYIGDYQKSEQNLTLEDVIELLKKNKKKLKIDPTGRKEQTQLETEYKSSLETLLPIKTQLTMTDRLIDAIVYKLYGLTEAEIAIVEGKV